MKKTLFCSILLLLVSGNQMFGQSAFLDAKFLKRYIKDDVLNAASLSDRGEKIRNRISQLDRTRDTAEIKKLNKDLEIVKQIHRDSVYSVLRRYGFILDSANATIIDSLFNLNPFLKGLHIVGTTKSLNVGGAIKSAISSVGGLDVTSIANAVAAIMIERAKQELTAAFFERFKKFAEENPEFGILFPKTVDNLNRLLSYKYPEMLPALRSGFLEDIRMITYHLDDVLELPRYKEFFKDLPEATIAIRSLRLVHDLESGASNAAEVIKEFAAFEEWETGSNRIRNVGSILKISALFSESIRSDKNDEIWVSARKLKPLFHDQLFFKIYLGLLYQVAKMENLMYIKLNGDSILVTDMLEAHVSDILTIQAKVRELTELTERVNTSFLEIKTKGSKNVSNDALYGYINTSLDVVEYGFSLTSLFGEEHKNAREALSIVRQANDLYRNIYTKQYNQAIGATIDILTTIHTLVAERSVFVDASALVAGEVNEIKLPDSHVLVKKNDRFQILKGGNELASSSSLDGLVKVADSRVFLSSSGDKAQYPLDNLIEFITKVRPYAFLIANIAEAETEEDIKNAIENAILPVGSSAIKKYAIFNISVQSYLGARYNIIESSSAKTAWNDNWGVTAPIGFALSWGGRGNLFKKQNFFKEPGAFTIFVSLIDIGAIVDYELTTDDNGEQTQEYQVRLGQIFAPGGYIVYGFPYRIPLSLGIGSQYGPGLYDVSNGAQTIEPAWNLRVFLAVDIPFFNLHNNPRPVYYNKKASTAK